MKQDFWSRRKAQVAAEAAQEPVQDAPEMTDAEVLETLNLPDPDTIKSGDDVKGFMAKAVPDHLRRKALRQLWKTNPVLANLDGLVDYGEDFTDSTRVVEHIQTAYQVGKGMMAHLERLAQVDQPEQTEPEIEHAPEIAALQVTAPPEPIEIEADRTPEPRRHMRFSFPQESVT
ncbi:DUF3306 domain-containing protein [Loktanella sp. S4079]|uniref:DUF3306 domain-containing protein n=1 Tax=Loktanella sp. S4079 TaxID=579483 RepID=UPI0005F9E9D8|nr:DUF3306 domain-containing protein [Loktanella sp. S4079]KJZ20453.1 hypothetical protein TW80_06575 [Loktanella sp. S4079]